MISLPQKAPTMTEEQRVLMTASCRDCDAIAKVADAGKGVRESGHMWQIMFNGLQVRHGAYYGKWMSELIRQLQGHHEPQEELVFHRVLSRLPPRSRMIELGCYWGFYSMWFARDISDARVVLTEPDPRNLDIARQNFRKNNLDDTAIFYRACAGFDQQYPLRLESTGDLTPVDGMSVSRLMELQELKYLELLHMDVQGAECDVLESLMENNLFRKIRFLFVSTHHYQISRDPLVHERCLHAICQMGGHIVAEHTVDESFSGDGFIVASFSELDQNFTVPISRNRASQAFFRPLGYDLAQHKEKQ